MAPEPFTIDVPDAVLDDLRRRLDATRWPDQAPGDPWSLGIPVDVMREAVDHWRTGYDWRAREARMNAWPNFVTEAAGERVHFIHVRSPHVDATPIVLTHGWPGSFVEFLDVLGPLTDPTAHGGRPEDAFHVVVPSMPGYGFSGPTMQPGFHVDRVADAVAEVMMQLGYDRYIAQGGDWGAIVTRRLGEAYPDRLLGVHVNMLFAFPGPDDDAMAGVTDAEKARMGAAGTRIADGTGYMSIQSTRPQTLAYGLTDSPAGLAAWILEKFHAWSDLEPGGLDATFGWDRLLDNLTVYWVTNTAGSAARLYAESTRAGNGAAQAWTGRVDVPTGHAVYPYELLQTPRAWADRRYRIVHWTEQERGGHFAAFERPDAFVADLRAYRAVVA
ncbi:MAG: epoxide hydrolase 1 [Acidimicrobiia bacterium]|nr:epoxide hydrolase 1 [Acidimicrobiia bacterium]